jgi:hypothetical protein
MSPMATKGSQAGRLGRMGWAPSGGRGRGGSIRGLRTLTAAAYKTALDGSRK